MTRTPAIKLVVLLLAAAFTCFRAEAQCTTTDIDTTPPTSTSGTTQVGTTWNWGVDQAPVTTTLVSQAGFGRSTTTPCELLQIAVPLASARTVHEVHGQVSFAVWSGSPCQNGSVIGQVRDQNGNVIATLKLQQFGASTVTVPISGTFPNPLSVSALQIQYFADLCGTMTWSWSLVMS